MSRYADIVLPLAFDGVFSYRVPEGMAATLHPGCRVRVPFGTKSHRVGVVMALGDKAPGFEVKDIERQLDEAPVVTSLQLDLWKWIASYYACSLGEVLSAALPSALKEEQGLRPKTESYLRLSEDLAAGGVAWDEALSGLGRAKKQRECLSLLRKWLATAPDSVVSRSAFLETNPTQTAALKALVERGLVHSFQQTPTAQSSPMPRTPLPCLSRAQAEALEAIRQAWQTKMACLLHGVTSSGKTEVYIHLIQECLDRGEQVLYLLPEISITTQITSRLAAVFGDEMAVYHSQLSEGRRREVWMGLADGRVRLVVGARSSVFLPFRRVGLIIVDEEHEPSYKQQEPAPRYHARNTALMLARIGGAKCLLGSATPSIESYHNARTGKYGLVSLTSRYGEVPLPEIQICDTKRLKQTKRMQGLFSEVLLEKMQEAFDEGRQVILFHNHRGYASFPTCRACDWTPKCPRCEVTMTYHEKSRRLQCHYCGHTRLLEPACPQCGSPVNLLGCGTEQVVEELQARFPDRRIRRMDTDSMTNRRVYQQLLEEVAKGDIDVLVGTQMLAKGLDFDRVQVVGVLNADSMMNQSDFRAHERAFQLMVQVSGRAGRKDRQGCVILQTGQADAPLIDYVKENRYLAFFADEMVQRQAFSYPPYAYLIDVWFKHTDQRLAEEAAECFAQWIRPRLPEGVFGPFSPLVGRQRGVYIEKLTIKINPSMVLSSIKEYLVSCRRQLLKNPRFNRVRCYFDVDPMA